MIKEQILIKAVDLFLTFGFKSVTMDDIAKDMGISKKTIYSHFSNKEKLVEATAFIVFEKIKNGIDKICVLEKNPIDEVFAIKSLILSQLKDEKSSPQFQLQKYYPKIFKALKHKQFELIKDCVSNNLKKGIEEGFFRKEIDIVFISRLYFNGMLGIRDKDMFPENEFTNTYLIYNYLEYHIRAIATKKGLITLNQNLNK